MKSRAFVVGGGPAGSVAAFQLAKLGIETTVADNAGDAFRVGESVPPELGSLLEKLGLAEVVASNEHLPCPGYSSAWGDNSLHSNEFILNPYGHGWHLDRQHFDASLLKKAESSGVTILRNTKVERILKTRSGWTIVARKSHNTHSYESDWLIDASGRSRLVTRQLGIQSNRIDSLVAIMAMFTSQDCGSDINAQTVIESVENGWWHSALLYGGRRVFSFFVDGNDELIHEYRSADRFVNEIRKTTHIGKFLSRDKYELSLDPFTRAANTSIAQRVAGDQWIAIGDAAYSCDPLSSAGIFTAISHASNAARIIISAIRGDISKLMHYQRTVKTEFADYLNQRRNYYAIEQRWLDHSFWKSRSHSL